MLLLAPKLTEKALDQLLRYFAKLQMDEQVFFLQHDKDFYYLYGKNFVGKYSLEKNFKLDSTDFILFFIIAWYSNKYNYLSWKDCPISF